MVVAHAFDSSMQEKESDESLSLKPARSTEGVQRLYHLEKNKRKQNPQKSPKGPFSQWCIGARAGQLCNVGARTEAAKAKGFQTQQARRDSVVSPNHPPWCGFQGPTALLHGRNVRALRLSSPPAWFSIYRRVQGALGWS